ncbi:MAG: hypothetical protein LBE10_11655 [Treponema sp.]|jgi:hypothetical protein|nr:hypothetical protein [Treponema sp.]
MKTKEYTIFYPAAALLAAALFASVILAGCNNPSSSGPEEETESESVDIGIDLGGNLATGGGSAVIYKDREPSRLELTVTGAGWTNLSWRLDGRTLGTGESLTINAADYAEARYTLAVSGVREGSHHSTAFTFTVTTERAADIIWTQTADDSSLTAFDLFAWAGDGTPTEKWVLEAMERETVYFAVRKSQRAAVAVRDISGGTVAKAAPGETVDGSMADGTLDIFTVTLDDPDAVFAGGECRFTLEAVEQNRQVNKTVQVSVAIKPNLTGAAIFRRNEAGGLTRITTQNAAAHANSLYADHKAGNFPAWGIDFAGVINLATALKWLDNYALSGTPQAWAEYLVRVEAGEVLPKTLISCRLSFSAALADYVRIRIRGYGGERKIIHDRNSIYIGEVQKGSNIISANTSFLSVGPSTSGGYTPNHIAVHLENNITIDAEGGTNPTFPTGNSIDPRIVSMVSVSIGNTLVMEAGSKLTNYVTERNYYDFTAVNILAGGAFEWRGGEISNIRGVAGNIILCSNDSGADGPGAFYYWGKGVTWGNTADNVAVGSYYSSILYDPSDPLFAP